MTEPARSRRRLVARLAFLAPVLVVAAWSCLMHPLPRSLLAPLFGPWAGVLYGHEDCTLAHEAPSLAAALLALGLLALLLLPARRGWLRPLSFTSRLAFVVLWTGTALLSVANTME